MKAVSFGQYYPVDSVMHRVDPRSKLIFLVAFIVVLFCADNFWGMGVCALTLALGILLSKVPFRSVLASVKGIAVLLVFTGILNLFFYKGETVLVEWLGITVYVEGLYSMLFLMARLFMLVMASALLTLTTTPIALTDGLESLLTPLKWVKFPVRELALIMSIALRFIPTLIDETERIINAQKARGADFESGSLIKRVRAIVPILIPLLIGSFKRAEELGDAMDARCYTGSSVRTKYKKLQFARRDLVFFGSMLILIASVVAFNCYGSAINAFFVGLF